MRDPLVIEAGTLRHPVAVQSQGTGQDAFGQEHATWNTMLSTRAAIRTLTLTERSNASGFISNATHRVTMRYQSSVPLIAGMRIIYGNSRIFLIQAVENVLERNRVITCLALEQEPTQ
jgi:SPP1 family predicted phage head-tail adaptor